MVRINQARGPSGKVSYSTDTDNRRNPPIVGWLTSGDSGSTNNSAEATWRPSSVRSGRDRPRQGEAEAEAVLPMLSGEPIGGRRPRIALRLVSRPVLPIDCSLRTFDLADGHDETNVEEWPFDLADGLP
jgi:hypothetical protein